MKIGIDCRELLNAKGEINPGVGHMIYFLVLALEKISLKHELILCFDKKSSVLDVFKSKKNFFKPFINLPIFTNHFLFSRFLNKENLDVFLGPANNLPLGYGKNSVVIVHDLAIFIEPDWFPKGQFFSTKIVLPNSFKKAASLISVSQTTAADLMKFFNRKSKVIHEGVSLEKIGTSKILKKKQLLVLGTLNPRKNICRVIEAFENASLKDEYNLVIAGNKGFESHRVLEKIKNSPKKKNICYKGPVSEKEKWELLRESEILLYPSLYEGFGLPILEAFSVGTCVLTSNISSMPEVSGEGAYLVDPYEVKEIQKGIEELVNQGLKKSLIEKGFLRVKDFSWESTAKQVLSVLENSFNQKEK